jgi:tripartite-type tricarboxylate transporter receptor subunit TctC
MNHTFIVTFIGIVLCLNILLPHQTLAKDYYEGKTITIVVPWPAGSGGDLGARMFAKTFQNHIPGKPTIIVRNMAGGRGVIALNFVYEKAPKDGTTLYHGDWNAAGVLANDKGIRYVPEKFAQIGSIGFGITLIVRTDTEPSTKEGADLVNVKELILGGRGAANEVEVASILALEILGVKYRYISGYKGMKKIAPAIKSGEIQAGTAGNIGYHTFFTDELREGKVIGAFYHPDFDEFGKEKPITEGIFPKSMRSLTQIYKETHNGKAPSGIKWETYKWFQTNIRGGSHAWFAPPGTPKEAVKILQKAYISANSDEEYIKAYTKAFGVPYKANSIEQTLKIFKEFRNASPEILAVLEDVAKTGRKK